MFPRGTATPSLFTRRPITQYYVSLDAFFRRPKLHRLRALIPPRTGLPCPRGRNRADRSVEPRTRKTLSEIEPLLATTSTTIGLSSFGRLRGVIPLTNGIDIDIDKFRHASYVWKMRVSMILLLLAFPAIAQQPLQRQIQSIAADAHGKVSVACSLPGTPLNCNLDPTSHPPMQSVFKLPLALTILHQVEQGRFNLDQSISFQKSDLILPKPYSPLQDKYPEAGVEVPLGDLLEMTVSLSDNTAADMLLRLAGGAKVVGDYIASLGIRGFHLKDGESALHRDHALQYRNWFEAQGAIRLLRAISDHSPLTAGHTALLLAWMRSSRASRLGLNLPEGTTVAHKAGTSGVDHGIAAATNDIGLITLPDGRQLAIAVFVTDSTADEPTRSQVIARIGRAVYDYVMRNP